MKVALVTFAALIFAATYVNAQIGGGADGSFLLTEKSGDVVNVLKRARQ